MTVYYEFQSLWKHHLTLLKKCKKYNIRKQCFVLIPLVKLGVDKYKNERLALIDVWIFKP